MPVDNAFKPLKDILSRLGRKEHKESLEALLERVYQAECPGNDELKALTLYGLYEPIARAVALGCEVNEDLAWEALAFFLLSGDHGKARILKDYLGFDSSPPIAVALCTGERRVLVAGGRVFDSALIKSPWRVLGVEGWLWSVARSLGLDTVAHWGCGDSPGVDLRILQRELIPEIDDNLASLVHGLGLDPYNIGDTLLKIAGFFAWLTDKVGHHDVRRLSAFKGYWESCRGGQLIVTDSPRIDVPEYSPFSLDPGRISSITALSIHVRGVDPVRVSKVLKDKGMTEIAAEISSAAIESRPQRGHEECIQVLTNSGYWSPGLTSRREIVLRCVEPLTKCIVKPETRVGIEYDSGSLDGNIPKSLNRLLEASRGGKGVRIYTVKARGPELAKMAARLARDHDVNVLVPSDALKRILVKLGFVDAGLDPDAPFRGARIVASWRDLLEKPYLSSYRFLIVLPEALVRGPPYAVMLNDGLIDDVVSDIVSLVGRLGGVALSLGLSGEPIEPETEPGRDSLGESLDPSLVLDDARKVFEELWGRDRRLRNHQEFMLRILASAYSQGHTRLAMGVFPTGSGKSAIFQVAARSASLLGYGGYTLVVSPLKALMRDQVEGAIRRGLNALRVDSSVPPALREKAFKAARLGLVDLLYVTPERFQDESLVSLVKEKPPALIVLDEAHTLSLWGATFRPSYLYMAKILAGIARELKWPPILLLTATAPEDLAVDILSKLSETSPVTVRVGDEIPDGDVPVIVRASPIRDELVFDVMASPRGEERIEVLVESTRKLVEFAEESGRPWFGIVFTGFVKRGKRDWATIDTVGGALERALDVPVIRYHGQLPASTRRRVENKIYSILEEGGSAVIVATKAFGMGVDIPVIRWVVHYYPSDSMEDFYQEAGRAGRDGKKSIVLEIFNPDDFIEKASMIRRQRIKPSIVIEAYNSIVKLLMATRDDALVLPVEVLRGFGDDPLRLLDSMREAGLIDYTLARSRLAVYKALPDIEPLLEASYWTWKISRDYYIGPETALPGAKPVSYPRIVLCEGERSKVLRVETPFFMLSPDEGCGEILRVAHGSRRDMIALVSLPPKPAPIDFLRPGEMQKILLSAHSMKKALDYLKDTLEEALASKSMHGPEGADKVVKKRVAYYFESRRSRPSISLADIARIRTRCLSLERCVPLIVETVKDAVEAVGYSGVTLAVKNPRIASVLNRELVSQGVKVKASEKAYKAVANVSRDSLLKLMDYGYIIVVVDNPSVATERVIDRISEYPYSAIYVVDTIG